MRLTLLCGGVILLSGGLLVVIAFAFGGHQAGTVHFAISRSGHGLVVAGSSAGLPIAASGGSQSGRTTTFSGHGSSGGPTVEQVTQFAAQIGSSRAVNTLFLWAILGLGIVTALGLALGWAFSGRMLRPLRTMRDTTQRISEANLHERLALAGPQGDELRDLGDTIDRLLGRLETAFEAQRRFVQNAAHELRTPITMMRTSVDVATGKPSGVSPEVTVLATKLGEGLDQAERLLESFLTLARVQSGSSIGQTSVSLPETVADVLAADRAMIARLGIVVELALGDASGFGNATLIERVVANLVDNAVRHNSSGGWLRIATDCDEGAVRLVVENGGERLDQESVDRLGQPFERLVAERTASDGGVGLGLSIVAAIVESHGGTMTLLARTDGGLRAEVELPAARPPSTRERP